MLTATNAIVDEVNNNILGELPRETLVTYHSVDEVDASTPDEQALWPVDFLNSLTPSGMPPHELTLAPGVLVMLLRNLDADAGLCNGVRAIVVHALPRVLDVLLVSGSKAGARAFIPRLVLAPKNPDLPFVLRRRQLPVKLAWCMTLNKAQGQTLKKVGLYLSTPVFSHGQYYVGLSRAGSFEAVKVLVVDHEKQGLYEDNEGIPNGVYTDNVVWKEALLQREVVDVCNAPPLSSNVTSQTMSTENRQVSLAGTLAVMPNSPGETMTDYIDEGSGAPATPRNTDVQQPLDRHGTDDTDEYGAAPAHASASNVTIVGTATGSVLDLDPIEDMVKPDELEQDGPSEPTPEDMDAFWKDLEQRAKARGVGPSEWHGLRRQPLWQVLISVEALEHPTSPSVGSSS